jgi:hypothetical protein
MPAAYVCMLEGKLAITISATNPAPYGVVIPAEKTSISPSCALFSKPTKFRKIAASTEITKLRFTQASGKKSREVLLLKERKASQYVWRLYSLDTLLTRSQCDGNLGGAKGSSDARFGLIRKTRGEGRVGIGYLCGTERRLFYIS